MTTTESAPSAPGPKVIEDFDGNVREIVKMLMPAAGLRAVRDLGLEVGISTSVIYARMKGNPGFTAEEIYRLALFFEPGVFYEPVELLRARLRRSGCFVPDSPADLHVLPPMHGQLAWLDDQLWPDDPRTTSPLSMIA